jgi:hypothetical protein
MIGSPAKTTAIPRLDRFRSSDFSHAWRCLAASIVGPTFSSSRFDSEAFAKESIRARAAIRLSDTLMVRPDSEAFSEGLDSSLLLLNSGSSVTLDTFRCFLLTLILCTLRLGKSSRLSCSNFLYIIKGALRAPGARRSPPSGGPPPAPRSSAASAPASRSRRRTAGIGTTPNRVGAGRQGSDSGIVGSVKVLEHTCVLIARDSGSDSREVDTNGVRVSWVKTVAVGGTTAGSDRATCRRKRRLRQGGTAVERQAI